MKLIASICAIPLALCLSGTAFAGDDLTTSGDAKSLGFSAARLARIAPWYQARFVRAARRFNAVQLQIRVEQGKLVAEATGAWVLNPGPWEQKAAMMASGPN